MGANSSNYTTAWMQVQEIKKARLKIYKQNFSWIEIDTHAPVVVVGEIELAIFAVAVVVGKGEAQARGRFLVAAAGSPISA